MTPKDQALSEANRKWTWIEEYKCGCTLATAFTRDLPGYCEKHGADRIHMHKVEDGTLELGHAK